MSEPESNNKHMQLLMHAIEGVNRTLELRSLLTRSMNSAKTLMKAEASTLMLADKITGELSVSIPTGPVGNKIKGISIPRGKGISGWVAENKKPYLSNKPDKSEIFWKDLSPDFKTKNILCVPLLDSKYKAIGVLQVLNKNKGEDFNTEDQQLFEVFASYVSTAIEKVREVDELRKKVENRDERLRKVHEELRDNLITINSFLQIEAEKTGDNSTRNILRAACSRVLTIANAHFLLKHEEHMEKMEMGIFINELFASVSAVFSDDEKQIKVILETEKIYVEAEKAFTLGLIVNEVLVLLFRFAFEYRERGEIRIKMKKENQYLMIDISDNGAGLQIDLAEQQSNINLTNVLITLSKSLGADINLRENEIAGTTFSIKCVMD